MNSKTAELLLAQQQLKDAQQRVELLQMDFEDFGEKYVVEWVGGGMRQREVFDCMDSAANRWKDIAVVCCPTLHKIFV